MASKSMDNHKDNEYFVKKVITHLRNIVEFMDGVDSDEFSNSKVLQSAICFEFIQVYENTKNITDDILDSIADFPLSELRGFRNKLVHEYGKVDYNMVFDTAANDVPELLEQLGKILNL